MSGSWPRRGRPHSAIGTEPGPAAAIAYAPPLAASGIAGSPLGGRSDRAADARPGPNVEERARAP